MANLGMTPQGQSARATLAEEIPAFAGMLGNQTRFLDSTR